MKLLALGGLRLDSSTFTRPMPLLLLAYLALEGSRQRTHLADLFWQAGNRAKNLSMAFTLLRKGAGDVLEVSSKEAKISIGSDVNELLEALDKRDWAKAANLYVGAFLEGVVLEDWSSELEEWAYQTREYLAERVQSALLNLAEEAAKRQAFEAASALAERAYKLPGLAGTDLVNLQRLYPVLCAGSSLLAPEVRREAESYGVVLQLKGEEARLLFRPDKTPTTPLPTHGTSFVGRDVELTELATLLNKQTVSLVTLLGTAGLGKTRLALQLAFEQQKLGAFKDGVYFVPLESLEDARLIPATLLSHFELQQQSKTEPLQQLIDFIEAKRMLLVLDNAEQVTAGVVVLSLLLSNCPNLKLLVTSRETLKLEEEHVFALEGLSVPKTLSDDATLTDAVQLFRERAQQVQPQFDLAHHLAEVVRICELVEGLPLGIELAASWLRTMSCAEIASELEKGLELLSSSAKNIPERHRSLRAAFEASWKLLTAKEQDMLRRLSVFRSGFRREAASDVAAATIPLLASLVDKSLLRVLPNGRYDFHPLLLQYIKEALAAYPHEEKEVRAKHARYFLDLVRQAEPHLHDNKQQSWFQQLDEELDNLRLALGYWLEQQGETALEMAGCLGQFWFTRGYISEGLKWVQHAWQKRQTRPTAGVAKALLCAGKLTWFQGEANLARDYYEASLTLAQQLSDAELMAEAFHGLGQVAFYLNNEPEAAKNFYEQCRALAEQQANTYYLAVALEALGEVMYRAGESESARPYFEESLRSFKVLGNSAGITDNMNNLANLYLDKGELDKAEPLYVQTLELFRRFGDRRGTVQSLINLGAIAGLRGEFAKAAMLYQEALTTSRELGDKRGTTGLLISLGGVWRTLGDYQKAKSALEESIHLLGDNGNKWQQSDAYRSLAAVFEEQGDRLQAKGWYEKSLAAAREVTDKWGITYTLFPFALWHSEQGDTVTAHLLLSEALALAREMNLPKAVAHVLYTFALLEVSRHNYTSASYLFGHTEAFYEGAGIERTPFEQLRHERYLQQTRDHLGSSFELLFSKGKTLELESVLRMIETTSFEYKKEMLEPSA